jgi:hypothetical protein
MMPAAGCSQVRLKLDYPYIVWIASVTRTDRRVAASTVAGAASQLPAKTELIVNPHTGQIKGGLRRLTKDTRVAEMAAQRECGPV